MWLRYSHGLFFEPHHPGAPATIGSKSKRETEIDSFYPAHLFLFWQRGLQLWTWINSILFLRSSG
jgi:hypothetical protein